MEWYWYIWWRLEKVAVLVVVVVVWWCCFAMADRLSQCHEIFQLVISPLTLENLQTNNGKYPSAKSQCTKQFPTDYARRSTFLEKLNLWKTFVAFICFFAFPLMTDGQVSNHINLISHSRKVVGQTFSTMGNSVLPINVTFSTCWTCSTRITCSTFSKKEAPHGRCVWQ